VGEIDIVKKGILVYRYRFCLILPNGLCIKPHTF